MIRYAILLTAVLAAAAGAAAKFFPDELPRSTGKTQPGRVSIDGTQFAQPDGKTFEWRGITAFRLVELVASGKEAEAAAYLDWAAKNQITVVRVLGMARHLFQLTPEDGVRALPRLLELAADRGLHVEVVALADTAAYAVDLDAHVKAVGAIAAAHPNAFVEIANEPFHQTQHPSLHDRATLARLAKLIDDSVLVAYGSEAPGNSGGGDYVTVHMPRDESIGNRKLSGQDEWDHVIALAHGRGLVERYGRPVVSDEPIGAAATRQPGRRDNSPERFRAAALLTRMSGMHATFHYEGGLQARIPSGVEHACFQAWREAWMLLPAGIERAAFTTLETPRGDLFESRLGDQVWVLALNGAAPPATFVPAGVWDESTLSVSK